ncbi:uncharacterized protein LOC124495521 [Dermatophagoides farinae]|uniref:uncharacterized protein LOC124495521 n=1 Tax=Dermatophagoides farinae TaxID=6954 RepID=UPI003F613B87
MSNNKEQLCNEDETIKYASDSCSSDDSSNSEEFYDAPEVIPLELVNDNDISKQIQSNNNNTNHPVSSLMADSGIYSMNSSHVEPSQSPAIMETIENKIDSLNSSDRIKNESLIVEPFSILAPLPPPRSRKKKNFIRKTKASDELGETNTGNHSSAESQSVTNSIESATHGFQIHGQNLSSILDDIASIKGDLSITECDKQSAFHDDIMANKATEKKLSKQDFIFSKEQLEEISRNLITKDNNLPSPSSSGSINAPEPECLMTESTQSSDSNQVVMMNTANNEEIQHIQSDDIMPKCLNPLSLHLMKLTNTEMSNTSMEKETSSTSLADSTFKSVTSLISSTLNDMKIEKKGTLDKKNKKKLLDSIENDDEFDINDDDDEYDEYDKNYSDYKDGKLKSKIRDLKRIGSGLIKGVKGVKATSAKRRSTFHVDPNEGDIIPPAPPRYKLKVNHKRGSADFEGLKLIQEINDCKGAIWCMKFSNCSQLLAAAGQDHLLRVYCSQKSWKYFTQLRNKASGQHVSPNSTRERSSNGDSFGRSQTQKSSSYSRNGSLNTCDSHNNSSSSSNSSALAKEFYKDEDNTLSEEGPLLLFTIYRGHTADVLDLAWSKNHFLLSSSMDKTVRLWHITQIECLCTFRHIDFVTTIQFHPRDDRYFLSGSLDGKLRLWNIPDKRVTLWNEVPSLSSQRGSGGINNASDSDMNPSHGLITASSFVQNGKFAVIGTYDGRIIFYTTDQLKYFTQIHVNSKNSIGSSAGQTGAGTRRFRTNKVAGIESIDANNKILVTTNDSRLRLYDLRDLSLTCKYKGCINQSSQIKASVSHDHKYIICGSENNSFYLWRTQDNSTIGQRRDRNKQYECIRLLNIPLQQTIPSAVFPATTTTTTTELSTSSGVKNDSNNSTYTIPNQSETTKEGNTIINKVNNVESSSMAKSKESFDLNIQQPPSIASSSTSAPMAKSIAATKIVTSAIFASVPGQIEEKARYIIAAADFNGYIRIFSKH